MLDLFLLSVVVRDAFGDGVRSDIEGGGDGGSASHVAYDGFTGEKARHGENLAAEAEASFAALAIELGIIDTEIGIGRGAIGQGLGLALEFGEIGVVSVVAV